MSRRIAWFSSGAASAVAAKLANPDIIAYCDTGAEDYDNHRFLKECERWFGQKIKTLKNEKYKDTWDLWEKKRYLAGIAGAPCTRELKINPRLGFQKDGDIHIFGYTADSNDIARADALRENFPDLTIETPLIEKGITKAACLALVDSVGIKPPRVYSMGFPNANCIPCVKSQSPDYWALIRREFPNEFERMVVLSRELGVKLIKIKGERAFIDEIPAAQPTTKPQAPECDFLCHIVEQDFLYKPKYTVEK